MPLSEEFVAVFNNLMRSANKVDVMLFVKSRNDFLAESERNSSVVLTPALNVFVRIRPQKVAKQASVWYISGPHNSLNLLQRVKFRRESSMHAENLFIN